MQRITIIVLTALALLAPLALARQVQNENLANAIVRARQRNGALLQQYNWNSRIDITENGKLMDLRLDLVSVGGNGQLQRSLLNDQPGQLPMGFIRRGIGQAQQRQAEQLASQIGDLADQYARSSGDKMAAFILQAQVKPITTPDGRSLLQITGSGVVVPGDSVTMVFNGTTLLPTSMQVTTSLNGDPLTLSGSFMVTPTGLNAVQYLTAELASKNLSVNIHNFDFVLAN